MNTQEEPTIQEQYEEFVAQLVLNNRVHYSEIPYDLRVSNVHFFYLAVRAARDDLQDPHQFVMVIEQFLQDIDQLEAKNEIDRRLRRRATDAILGVERLFSGVVEFDEFVEQQKKLRSWLFSY